MDYSLDKKLQAFKQIAQEKLQATLCSIPSPKDLIIEPQLIKPLEHVCAASWVKSKGVQKIFKFDQKNAVPKSQNTQVFLINANLLTFKFILDQIHEHENNQMSSTITGIANYHIIVFPNVYNCFHTLLEEEGLYGIVRLHRFNWDFIYLDDGILSLEMPQVFSEIFLHQDLSIQSSIAHSLRILNMVIGKPEITLCFGEHSEKILEMVERLENSKKTNTKSTLCDFTAMIIIDRTKDYPSALLTPAIYSGLLLETFKFRSGELEITASGNKISNGKLKIFKLPSKSSSTKSTSDTSSSTPVSSSKVLQMRSTHDQIFSENRYKHFSEASNLVRAQAKALGVEIQNINKMKINEMHEYVLKRLPKITEMKGKIMKHLNVCEQIINELARNYQKQINLEEDILNNTNRKQILQKIDEILTTDGHKYNILRLLCLANLSMGLSIQELNLFIRNYCNIFGHKYLYVFQLLAKCNLLPAQLIENESIIKSGKLMTFSTTLTNLPSSISKFQQQTEFQANANRLKLFTSSLDSNPSIGENKSGIKSSATEQKFDSVSSTCASYVFNGLYIPLVAQLASILLKSENIDEINTKLGMIDKIKLHFNNDSSAATFEMKSIKQIHQIIKKGELNDKFPIKKRTLFVFVVGGITYAEIAACDLISKLTNSKIVTASNCICSGSDLISGAF